MTFSTLVTPTRESESESAGARFWTSSTDRVMTPSVRMRPRLNEWTKVSPRTDCVSRATKPGRRRRVPPNRQRANQRTRPSRRTSRPAALSRPTQTDWHGRSGSRARGSRSHHVRRIEGLGTKTEALLADEAAIHEIDELRPLIAEGQERGFLTVEQIAASLEEVEVTKEQVAELHAYLLDQGIEVLSADGKPVTASEPDGRSRKDAPDGPRKPEIDLTVEPSLDSLRLYLRSIGKVSLLTADREVELARRIERGDLMAKQEM